ncbi:aminotransferase class IV [Solwaraspora sp. WMMD791]|uniref:aminotransferase class IV n=1 Tax=Solwaraspora sp. WMMD791 TaxID=3016086 RepID=UPI00249B1AF0|nr:aminotransferase class IV [Solwaraspora sp. WMMD791]WFE28061.1 aminotransferase class IV [Solwaraspora sp. WMMD791]
MTGPLSDPVWSDGRPATPDELSALGLANFGHFTTMTVASGRVRGLRLHLRRLVDDCRAVFDTELDPGQALAGVRRAVGRAAATAVTVRVTVFDPALNVLGPVDSRPRPRVLIATRPAVATPLPPLRLRTYPYQRDLPAVKHTGLFGAVRLRRAARADGADDALFVADGQVLEGPTWNLGLVVDGEVRWPAGPCLPGVTMRLVSAAAGAAGMRCRTAPLTLADLARADGVFVTNASVGVRAVATVDGAPIAGTPLVRRLARWYAEYPADQLEHS